MARTKGTARKNANGTRTAFVNPAFLSPAYPSGPAPLNASVRFPFLDVLKELQNEIFAVLAPSSLVLLRFTSRSFYSHPALKAHGAHRNNFSLLEFCARENNISLFEFISAEFFYPGANLSSSHDRFRFLLAAVEGHATLFFSWYLQIHTPKVTQYQMEILCRKMGELGYLDLYETFTWYFTWEPVLENRNSPSAFAYVGGYFASDPSIFSFTQLEEVFFQLVPKEVASYRIGKLAAQSQRRERVEYMEARNGARFHESWLGNDNVWLTKPLEFLTKDFLQYILVDRRSHISKTSFPTWLMKPFLEGDLESVKIFVGRGLKDLDEDFIDFHDIDVPFSFTENFRECFRILFDALKLGSSEVLKSLFDFGVAIAQKYDLPEVLDWLLAEKFDIDLKFVPNSAKLATWLEKTKGILALDEIYMFAIRERSLKAFKEATLLRPFNVASDLCLTEIYTRGLNYLSLNLEIVVYLATNNLLSEADWAHVRDQQTLDEGILRYLQFHS